MIDRLRAALRLARTHGLRTGSDYASGRPLVRFPFDGCQYVMARDRSTEYHLRESTPKLERLAAAVEDQDEYVLDVGAHSGLFAAMVLHRHPTAHVACMEPDPSMRSALEANLRGRAAIITAAAAGGSGRATLWHNEASTQTSSLDEKAARAFGDARPLQVDTLTIDQVVGDLGWPRVDVLKVDVQSGEGEALDGADKVLAGVRVLLIEVSFLDSDVLALLTRLRDEFTAAPAAVNSVYMGADLVYRR